MTVKEMLNSLSDLPLDVELYIEIDSGRYVQAFLLIHTKNLMEVK